MIDIITSIVLYLHVYTPATLTDTVTTPPSTPTSPPTSPTPGVGTLSAVIPVVQVLHQESALYQLLFQL